MAKQNMIQREYKRTRLITRYQKKRLELKKQFSTEEDFITKQEIQQKLQKLPRNSAPSRHRNRCWATGRSRAYYRDFGLSRHVLREMAHECLLPGVTKSSW
uniref:ribosomal protein S14 n=1 Tax=Goniotrichopsis reniformis TaxID=468933 RepID=UPI001FCD812D|nr:ribosomal protein S14 [Goniotrichopsis reniformis]UNJ14805.1 ribosomal protein S14 [Goniotrichopsis reniformis]